MRHRVDLVRRGVRGMHQLPAGAQRDVLRQPLDRALPGGGHAIVDLGRLFGDVDVDRAIVAGAARHQFGNRPRGGGTQRVDRHAGADARQPQRPHAVAPTDHVCHRRGESPLIVAQRRLRETRALVQHRQQRQSDAGARGRAHQRVAHRQRVGVACAVARVVQVVELAHLRVAAAQQLDIQLRRHRLELIGVDAQRHAVHAVAPAPEVVVRRLAPLGQAGKGALKRMAVRVDQTRQHRTVESLGPWRSRRVGPHLGPGAVACHRQQHRVAPLAVEPRPRRPQQGRHRSGLRHAGPSVASSAPAAAAPSARPPPTRRRTRRAPAPACSSASTTRAGSRARRVPAGRSAA